MDVIDKINRLAPLEAEDIAKLYYKYKDRPFPDSAIWSYRGYKPTKQLLLKGLIVKVKPPKEIASRKWSDRDRWGRRWFGLTNLGLKVGRKIRELGITYVVHALFTNQRIPKNADRRLMRKLYG